MMSFDDARVRLHMCSFGAICVRVCSFFDIQRLLQFIWRNAAASVTIRAALMTEHLLSSLPRGNLVDGVPRVTSLFN